MSITLYELCGDEDRRFSPFCWRRRMALAHKGLDAERVAVTFSEKDKIAFSGQQLVPVLTDADTTVADSWAIACYLEQAYADRPSLFGGPIGQAQARFINFWADQVLNPAIGPLVIWDLFDHVAAPDRDYFLSSREARYGKPLQQIQHGREERVGEFRARLAPLRATLEAQPYISGEAPAYADYIVFGGFQWARIVSPFALLADDDPVNHWRKRMLGLFDGLAGNTIG